MEAGKMITCTIKIKEVGDNCAVYMEADNENGTETERKFATVLDAGVKAALDYVGRDNSTMIEARPKETLPGFVKETIERVFGK